MLRALPMVTALSLVVAFGVLEGLWTDRWGTARDPGVAAARLADIPLGVGDWQGEALEMDAQEFAKAEISGYAMRRYVNQSTGASLTVLLVCGRPGPVSLHPPDVCYSGAGYDLVGEPVLQSVEVGPGGKTASFRTAPFVKTAAPVPEPLRILWSWSASGTWSAEDNPRLSFARAPVLYKLYVIRSLQSTDEPLDKDPALGFLQEFLPQVESYLFPSVETK